MKIFNYLLVFTIIFIIGASVFWLWQRQPKSIQQDSRIQATPLNNQEIKTQTTDTIYLVQSPKDEDILDTNTIKFAGKTNNQNKVLIISNSINDLASVNTDGTFEITENLDDGLNLVNVIALDKDLKEAQKQTLSLYVSEADSKDKVVGAGTVNKIFENIITITTANGDINIKRLASTTIASPKPNAKSTSPLPKTKDGDIRVGDYLIALGTSLQDKEVTASTLQVIRDDKPQVTKKYVILKLASATKLKLFSGTNLTDNKLLEFKIDKTNFIDKDKKSDEKSIVKDKKALVFYTPTDSDNIASLVYILP